MENNNTNLLDEDEFDKSKMYITYNNILLSEMKIFKQEIENEDVNEYINSLGVAKFYSELVKYKIDKLINDLYGWNIIELIKIVDKICTLIKDNHTKFISVNNGITCILKELDGNFMQNTLIFQGVREWFEQCELSNNDLGIIQISESVQNIHENFLFSYYLEEDKNPEDFIFVEYLKSTWMMDWLILAIEKTFCSQKNKELIMSYLDNNSENTYSNSNLSNTNSPIKELNNDIRSKIYPTIDNSKYNPNEIFRLCNRKNVFQCEKDVFDNILVFGCGNKEGEKIRWIYMDGIKSQLRPFIEKMTGVNIKPKTINKMFDVEKIDSNDNAIKLNDDLNLILTLSPLKKVK